MAFVVIPSANISHTHIYTHTWHAVDKVSNSATTAHLGYILDSKHTL